MGFISKVRALLKASEHPFLCYSILLINIPKIIMSAKCHLKMSVAEFTIVAIPSDHAV